MANNSIIDLGLSKLPEEGAKVAIKLIDKISDATGYAVKPKGTKLAKINAEMKIINEIAENRNINTLDRLAIISNRKKIVKEYVRNSDIIKNAIGHLQPSANPENINEDWLCHFFDKSKNICSEDMKMIWGKVLAQEANEQNSISKKLLDILSVMNSNDAQKFMSLIPYCVDADGVDNPIALMIINYDDEIYAKKNISFSNLLFSERLGLIKEAEGVYFVSKEIGITYGQKKCIVSVVKDAEGEYKDNEILVGNYIFTYEGIRLAQICERTYDYDFYNYLLDFWENQGLKVELRS